MPAVAWSANGKTNAKSATAPSRPAKARNGDASREAHLAPSRPPIANPPMYAASTAATAVCALPITREKLLIHTSWYISPAAPETKTATSNLTGTDDGA